MYMIMYMYCSFTLAQLYVLTLTSLYIHVIINLDFIAFDNG